MPVSILYLVKLSVSLAMVWLFYRLLLRRLTFFSLNRWYLLGYSLLSFIIPLINIGPLLPEDTFPAGQVIQYIPVIGGEGRFTAAAAASPFTLTGWNIVLAIGFLGAVVLGMRLAIRWLSLGRVRRKARLIETVGDQGVRIYQVEESILPFSFGNAIYINGRQHSEKEWEDIILHEYVHIRQRHTVDILVAEGFCILNWYNPFAWLIRYSIRQNLEFIADQKVLENGKDRKSYQYHLLKVIGESRYRLANNFNFSSLKKRIIMMNKLKSTRLHLVKFLFAVPLIAVLLLAFRDQRALRDPRLLRDRHATARDRRLPPDQRATVEVQRAAVGKPSFEKLMGKLRDTVPSLRKDTLRPPGKDTLPEREALVPKNGAPGADSSRPNPLWFVDGKEISKDQLSSVMPDEIESMTVLKGDSAVKGYGERARQGVALIKTKPPTAGNGKTMILYEADGNKVTIKADKIDWTYTVNTRGKVVYFVNGVKVPENTAVASLPQQQDIVMAEIVETKAVLQKYGLGADETLFNIVTRAGRGLRSSLIVGDGE